MFNRPFLCAAAIVALAVSPARSQNTLYFHDFNGPAGTPLHGLPADTNSSGSLNNWVTRTDTGTAAGTGSLFFADGTINGASGGNEGSAGLAFSPIPGNVYTLSASFGAVTAATNNWVALGFIQSPTSVGTNNGRFISGDSAGQPWMIYRGNEAVDADQGFLGPGTANVVPWTSTVTSSRGAPVDLRIILDTTDPTWSVEWQAKNPADANYTSVGTGEYTTNPTIGGIGIALAHPSVMSTISSLRLETSGEIFVPGDVTGDGIVDLLDFNAISDNLFNTGVTRTEGDLNGDATVNFADFRLWKAEVTPEMAAAAEALLGVPEPATGILACVGFLYVAFNWRRGRR